MDQLIQQILDIAHAMWQRRWIGVAVAWIVAILGAIGLTSVHNRYEASARVYVDTKTVLRPLMRDLAVEPDLEQTVGLLARTLITRPNVELLMRRSNLDSESLSPVTRDRLIESLMREIKVAASGRDNVFSFTYRDTQPERARIVVQNLVSLFLESDTGAKKRDAESAREFIDEQIKNYETRLAEAENRLKEFKLRNMGMADTGVGGRDYFARIAALTDDLNKLTVELRASEQSRDALKRELGGETASLLPELPPAGVAAISEYDARIESQRRQLDDMLRRYTDLHPDVVATKRLIARLEEQRAQELEARQKAAIGKPSHSTSNTQQQIRLALAESEASVASLRVRVTEMQGRLSQLRAAANRVPQIEAELAQLNRDYDVVRRTYETMVSRREKASLSEDVDATRSAQFRVIDPPRTAPQPVFPNRVLLAPAIVLAALLAGLAATFLVTQVFPTFESARSLRQVTKRPVLGSIAMIVDERMASRKRQANLAFGSALSGLVAVAGIWIAWISMQIHT